MEHKEMYHIHFKVRSIDNDTLSIASMTKTGLLPNFIQNKIKTYQMQKKMLIWP
jgi:hypothetical protein